MPEHDGMPGHGESYFVVLPDHEATLAVAAAFDARATHRIDRASGRPWLIGVWPEQEVTHVAAGSTRLAVIGTCPMDTDRLARAAGRMTDLADVERLARSLPGAFHLVAELNGRIRVRGTASGLRLVFHAEVGGVRVASDRADVLAALTGSPLDERQVAARLLWPVPHPLLHTPLWRHVTAVEPGHHLTVERDGVTARLGRWWTPPEPTRTIEQAADDVGAALAEAVDTRTRAGGIVSCDLSGGLDSTSLCFLAARGDAGVIASTWPGRDPADDDLRWAKRAAAHLPGVEHAIWPAEDSPLVYAGLLEVDDLLDEPTIGMVDRARVLSHLPRLAEKGSRLHLTGIGGDHVAWCSEAYYHGLLRRRPLLALGRLRGFRALFDWPAGAAMRALADGRSYRRWLADAARDLRRPPPPVLGTLGWEQAPRLFDWATEYTVHAAAEVMRDAARTAEPLAPDRGMHVDLQAIRVVTRILRQWDQMSARVGLPMASPFLDDRVIDACLAVRPEDRVTPWAYKPVLVAAMRGVVPDECLRRSSKAQAALDAAAGLREHRRELAALWEDSRLAAMGLVDAGRLRRLAERPAAPELREAILYSTIGCEVWLRTLTTRRAGLPMPCR